MKKAVVVLLAVAILGTLGLLASKNKTNTKSQAPISTSSETLPSVANSQASSSPNSAPAAYKDGTYTESSDTPYGSVKIKVVISGGKISDVAFLDMPKSDERSVKITADSSPKLKANAIAAQSPNIDFVSGATSTSYGFQESLQAALDVAKQS